MPQPFPPWSDALARMVLSIVATLLVGVPLFLMWWTRTPYVTEQFDQVAQPVAFDHRHHVVDDGIDCEYCHQEVERSPYAGVPATDTCLNCHSQIWNASPALKVVWQSDRSRRPILWQRVTYLPDFVFFNHSMHVRSGVGCETCHGRIDEMPRVFQVEPMTMRWCLDCHREPERYLRPREAVTVMGYVPDRPQRELGAELMRTYNVRRLTTCTTCHR
jgi:hypothetical protein